MWTLAEANAAHAPNDIYIIVRVRTFITETWEDHVWNKKKPFYLRSSFAALALLTARQKLHNERRVHGPIPTRQRNAVIRLLLPPQIIMSDALLNRRVYDIGKAWPRCQQTNTLFSLQKSNSAISHGSKMPLSSFAIWNDLCRYPGGIKVLVSCARQQNVTGLVRKGLRKAAARQVGLCRLYSPIKLKHEFYHVQFSSWLTQPLHLRYKQWTPLFPCCGPWYAKKGIVIKWTICETLLPFVTVHGTTVEKRCQGERLPLLKDALPCFYQDANVASSHTLKFKGQIPSPSVVRDMTLKLDNAVLCVRERNCLSCYSRHHLLFTHCLFFVSAVNDIRITAKMLHGVAVYTLPWKLSEVSVS